MDVTRSTEAYIRGFVAPHEPSQLSIRSLLSSVLAFYVGQSFDGLVSDNGDMLLFQFGIYDWGKGPHFEVDFTRQFIEVERNEDDDVFSQFRVTCYYKPTPKLEALGSDDRWCKDKSELATFTAFVVNHPVISATDLLEREGVEVRWGLV